MTMILILLAGGILGAWHEREKRRVARAAYKAGASHARNQARLYRLYSNNPRETIPVPGYSDGRVYIPSYARRVEGRVQ